MLREIAVSDARVHEFPFSLLPTIHSISPAIGLPALGETNSCVEHCRYARELPVTSYAFPIWEPSAGRCEQRIPESKRLADIVIH
jgi:hypothetical protein